MRAEERQTQLLAALREAIAEHGEAPTMRQLAHTVGLSSTSTVHHHLQRMKEAGLVRREAGSRRGRYLPTC